MCCNPIKFFLHIFLHENVVVVITNIVSYLQGQGPRGGLLGDRPPQDFDNRLPPGRDGRPPFMDRPGMAFLPLPISCLSNDSVSYVISSFSCFDPVCETHVLDLAS